MILLNKPDQIKFRELYENIGAAECAKEFNCSITIINRHARENKIYFKERVWTEEKLNQLIALMSHKTPAQIAEEIGVSKSQVKNRISAMRKAEKYLSSINFDY